MIGVFSNFSYFRCGYCIIIWGGYVTYFLKEFFNCFLCINVLIVYKYVAYIGALIYFVAARGFCVGNLTLFCLYILLGLLTYNILDPLNFSTMIL